MNNYPNVFNYATKELTQDAMVSWLLECVNNEDDNIKKIGIDFLKDFVFSSKNSFSIDIGDINHADIKVKTYRQSSRIDVFAYVKINKRVIAVIFENKTDTFLHGNQFYDYCKKVREWNNKEQKKLDNKKESELQKDIGEFESISDIVYIYK